MTHLHLATLALISLHIATGRTAPNTGKSAPDADRPAPNNNLPSVAFYYEYSPPREMLTLFDWIVVDPDHVPDPTKLAREGNTVFAYLSVGEVHEGRAWFDEVSKDWIRGENKAWNSHVVDLSSKGWRSYLLDVRFQELWNRGFRGFFLDTLDSYHLIAKTDAERKIQEKGLVEIVRGLHRKFPGVRIFLNRGFEILPDVHSIVAGVAAESLYSRFDPQKESYGPVPEDDRVWLLSKLSDVRNSYKLPVVSIDYVEPRDRSKMREVRNKILEAGFIPWVSDGHLRTIGIGSVEALPRKVLLLYDSESEELPYSGVHRMVATPFEYLGYVADYRDVRQPMPDLPVFDRYVGVVVWLPAEEPKLHALREWILREIRAGTKFVFLDNFAFELNDEAILALSLFHAEGTPEKSVRIVHQDAAMNFEAKVRLRRFNLLPVRARDFQAEVEGAQDRFRSGQKSNKETNASSDKNTDASPDKNTNVSSDKNTDASPDKNTNASLNKNTNASLNKRSLEVEPLLVLEDERREIYEPVAITAWGGYILSPYLTVDHQGHRAWLVNPFDFFRRAFRIENHPILDATTHLGRRILIVHIDGDGIANLAEMPGTPPAGEVILKEIIQKYPIPHTVSVVEGETGRAGMHPGQSTRLEHIARQIFELPSVEVASHAYSHPFDWGLFEAGSSEPGVHLPIPTYRPSLEREIEGSVNYINRTLVPKHKRCEVFLWSGNALPGRESLAWTERVGVRNMNGGDTTITRRYPYVTHVSPSGRPVDEFLQVYAPIMNENVFTNLWHGPYYGFESVVETFELTGAPRRLKPINIYYHFYSGSKVAGLEALRHVYDWVLQQETHPMFVSHFTRIVEDFWFMALGIDPDGAWVLRHHPNLKTLRLPDELGVPDLRNSTNVVGYVDTEVGRYVNLGPRTTSKVVLTNPKTNSADGRYSAKEKPNIDLPFTVPFLESSNADLTNFHTDPDGIALRLQGHQPVEAIFRTPKGKRCEVKTAQPSKSEIQPGRIQVRFSGKETGLVRLQCVK